MKTQQNFQVLALAVCRALLSARSSGVGRVRAVVSPNDTRREVEHSSTAARLAMLAVAIQPIRVAIEAKIFVAFSTQFFWAKYGVVLF